MSDDTVEVVVEIRYLRKLSIGIITAHEIDSLYPGNERLIWLPRAEIIEMRTERQGRATLTMPRWLADAERLIAETEHDAAQGSLL